MKLRFIYSLSGLFIGGLVQILFNLIAAAIQQQAFQEQFSEQSIWWLAGFAIVGLLIGYWLSTKQGEGLPPTQVGVKLQGAKGGGGLLVEDKAAGQIDVRDVEVENDILISRSSPPKDTNPKERPPT